MSNQPGTHPLIEHEVGPSRYFESEKLVWDSTEPVDPETAQAFREMEERVIEENSETLRRHQERAEAGVSAEEALAEVIRR